MAEDEQQKEQERSQPGGGPEQPPPPGTQPQAPAHDTALTELESEAGSGTPGAAGGTGGRLDELMGKRRTEGLSDAEAEELGKLLADQEGKEYSSAQSLKRAPGSTE
jgi:hypothetical protein